MKPSELQGLEPGKWGRRSFGHTNSSMRVVGYYPDVMSRSDVERKVQGTFGGRFEHFGDGTFEYIAYTG